MYIFMFPRWIFDRCNSDDWSHIFRHLFSQREYPYTRILQIRESFEIYMKIVTVRLSLSIIMVVTQWRQVDQWQSRQPVEEIQEHPCLQFEVFPFLYHSKLLWQFRKLSVGLRSMRYLLLSSSCIKWSRSQMITCPVKCSNCLKSIR